MPGEATWAPGIGNTSTASALEAAAPATSSAEPSAPSTRRVSPTDLGGLERWVKGVNGTFGVGYTRLGNTHHSLRMRLGSTRLRAVRMLTSRGRRCGSTELGVATCVLLRVPVARHLPAPKACSARARAARAGRAAGRRLRHRRDRWEDASSPRCGCPDGESGATPDAAARRAATRGVRASASASRRPNIVFVLTDDLSMDLVRLMPAGPGALAARHDLRQLLRHRLALLPVAIVDLHGQLPARHRRLHQRGRRTAGSARSTPTGTSRRASTSRFSRRATARR